MRTKKCENCGMRAYEQKNGVYVCKYCQTVYEEEPKSESALQTILGFTERQMDKRREEKVARRKRQEAEENARRVVEERMRRKAEEKAISATETTPDNE